MKITLEQSTSPRAIVETARFSLEFSQAGSPGMSAYHQWLLEGNSGTWLDFYESLRGPSQFLGEAAEAPTVGLKGAALKAGDMYFNTDDNATYFYDGSAWSSPEHRAEIAAQATAADRIQTGLDAQSAEGDALLTAADRIQTGLDVVATAADRVQTGLDVVTTGELAGLAQQDAIAAAESEENAKAFHASRDRRARGGGLDP